MSSTTRNVAAEVRFVEEGHHVFSTGAGTVLVHSDSRPGVTYAVTCRGVVDGAGRALVQFACTCPGGSTQPSLGVVCCKHAAGLARRLEREQLARFDADGLWHVGDAAPAPRPLTAAARAGGIAAPGYRDTTARPPLSAAERERMLRDEL